MQQNEANPQWLDLCRRHLERFHKDPNSSSETPGSHRSCPPGSKKPRSSHTGDGGGSRSNKTPHSSHTGDGGGSRSNKTPHSSHTGDGGGSRPTYNIDNESTVPARDRRKSTRNEDGLLSDEAKQILAMILNRSVFVN